jgi:hypothetical protein
MADQPSDILDNINFDNMSPVVNHDVFTDDITTVKLDFISQQKIGSKIAVLLPTLHVMPSQTARAVI